MYRPHPFSWRPATDRARHATAEDAPSHGAQFEALCGAVVTAVLDGDAWLDPTCDACNVAAHRMLGLPMFVAGAR